MGVLEMRPRVVNLKLDFDPRQGQSFRQFISTRELQSARECNTYLKRDVNRFQRLMVNKMSLMKELDIYQDKSAKQKSERPKQQNAIAEEQVTTPSEKKPQLSNYSSTIQFMGNDNNSTFVSQDAGQFMKQFQCSSRSVIDEFKMKKLIQQSDSIETIYEGE